MFAFPYDTHCEKGKSKAGDKISSGGEQRDRNREPAIIHIKNSRAIFKSAHEHRLTDTTMAGVAHGTPGIAASSRKKK